MTVRNMTVGMRADRLTFATNASTKTANTYKVAAHPLHTLVSPPLPKLKCAEGGPRPEDRSADRTLDAPT